MIFGLISVLMRDLNRTLAALGAAVTLLAVALDPFFQKVSDYPTRWTAQGNSTIPRLVHYETHYSDVFSDGFPLAAADATFRDAAPPFFWANGTQQVALGNGTRADIPISCPTSNCTWPVYDTLGVCSACADISQLLTHACLTTRIDWIGNLTGPDGSWPNSTVCGYFFNATSQHPVLMSGYNLEPIKLQFANASAGEVLLGRNLPLFTYPARTPLFSGSIMFQDIRHKIVDVAIVAAQNGSDSVLRNMTPVAHECILYWCVQSVKPSYYWASYREEVLQTFHNSTAPSIPFRSTRVSSVHENSTLLAYTTNITLERNDTTYGLSNESAVCSLNVFDDIFPSVYTVANLSERPLLRFRNTPTGALFQRKLDINPWIPPNNISHHFERMAIAISNALRSSTSSESLVGKAWDKETYVLVLWDWLILPLIILILTLIFLVATIMKTSRETEQVGIYKNSAFATVLHGLPEELKKDMRSTHSARTSRFRAKKMRVRFHPKNGWRVSDSQSALTQTQAAHGGAPLGFI